MLCLGCLDIYQTMFSVLLKGVLNLIKINYRDFGWNVIGGEFVIYSLNQDIYYRFNDSAKDIWEIMSAAPQGVDIDTIANKLVGMYNCTKDQVAQDVKSFVDALIEVGAVINVPTD